MQRECVRTLLHYEQIVRERVYAMPAGMSAGSTVGIISVSRVYRCTGTLLICVNIPPTSESTTIHPGMSAAGTIGGISAVSICAFLFMLGRVPDCLLIVYRCTKISGISAVSICAFLFMFGGVPDCLLIVYRCTRIGGISAVSICAFLFMLGRVPDCFLIVYRCTKIGGISAVNICAFLFMFGRIPDFLLIVYR